MGKAEAGERSVTKNFSAEFKDQSLTSYRIVLLRQPPAIEMSDQPPLDPKETLVYIRTLVRLASGKYDITVLHKLLKEMYARTDNTMLKRQK
ncbi:MAG: hypothetical protein K5821_00545 [Nitrobacter sp.]|uniref:hypothetical protein n=1 Tax=Nitrobacter sp. TaxID=29420 RepID=UPI0026025E10|nr:hypothetical protein [Nitrobacter sp.]MCV0384913.1 hypothetical protein [Nitrobacter sp.]